jgi:hypothetical protein
VAKLRKATPKGVWNGESMSEEKYKSVVWAKNIMNALDVLNWAKERECNMTLSFETVCRYLKAVARRNPNPLAEEALLRVISCGCLQILKFEDGIYRLRFFELPKTADVLSEWEWGNDFRPNLLIGYVPDPNGCVYYDKKIEFDLEKNACCFLFQNDDYEERRYGKYVLPPDYDEESDFNILDFIPYDGNIKELPEAGVVRTKVAFNVH